MLRRSCLCMVVVYLASFLVSCSDSPGNKTFAAGPVASSMTTTYPPNPIPRTNPLQTYIRTHFTSEDPNSTGGTHYSHIKVAGFCYRDLESSVSGSGPHPTAQDQANYIADHFDMYVWGGPIVGATKALRNPDMLWTRQAADLKNLSGWDSTEAETWLNDPAKNPLGYEFDDFVLNYQYDTTYWQTNHYVTIPGWNPSDDPDSSGCREANEGNGGLPSDTSRTAECLSDSRALHYPGTGPIRYWEQRDPTNEGQVDFVVDQNAGYYQTTQVDGYHFDNGAYTPSGLQLGNTFEYSGEDEYSVDFAYIWHRLYWVPWFVSKYEQVAAPLPMYFANMVSPLYACQNWFQKDRALEYLENAYLEDWLYIDYDVQEPTREDRSNWLDCIYVDWFENGKGLLLSTYDPYDTERGKLFSLAMFYMINHQMGFYYYRNNLHDIGNGDTVEDVHWNPWVTYEVGQPTINSLGYSDFNGQTGTNRYFELQSAASFDLIGREYLRTDGNHVLILVKLMADGQTAGASATSVALPGWYKELQSVDASGIPTWGDATNEVYLSNNDGTILIETDAPPPPPPGGGGGKIRPSEE